MSTQTSEEIRAFIDNAVVDRPDQEGIGIDHDNTARPEGVLYAENVPHAGYRFAASVCDPSIFDDENDQIRWLLHELVSRKPDERKNVELNLDTKRQQIVFRPGLASPAITVAGTYTSKSSFSNLSAELTKVTPELFSVKDPILLTHPIYLAAARLASHIRRRELGVAEPTSRSERSKPEITAAIFAHLGSIGISEIRRQESGLVLLEARRGVVTFMDCRPNITPIVVTPEPVSLLPYKAHLTVDMLGSNVRPQKTRQWLNAMSLGEFLKTGNQLFSFEEAYLLADWLNQRKIAQLIQKYGEAIMHIDFSAQPEVTL